MKTTGALDMLMYLRGSLKELRLGLLVGGYGVEETPRGLGEVMCELERLRTLHVDFFVYYLATINTLDAMMALFFDSILAPGLVELAVRVPREPWGSFRPRQALLFVDFLGRSGCTLCSLHFYLAVEEGVVIKCLEEFGDDLVRLDLMDAGWPTVRTAGVDVVTTELLKRLEGGTDTSTGVYTAPLCPRLKDLVLLAFEPTTQAHIISLVKSRANVLRCEVQLAKVQTPNGIRLGAMYKALEEAGIKVNWRFVSVSV
ncbi:hypothetical protein V5O48_018341 [Marasmius crinis-equi]|uniref:Uncharacterized protein n=1 Tax=Marasmius crinis-equi TaxID=585013 RepID=A0ABR3ELJ4_9AGAR